MVQPAFRAALPVLPYRQPRLLDHLTDIAPLLLDRRITSVLLVADAGVRRLGLTRPLEAIDFINRREHPLALYLFSEDRTTQDRFLRAVPFGGGCINDTIIHLATSRMGFGGIGHSGMGSYHGRKSFETFSHEKSIVSKSTFMDMPVRYMPYSPLKDRLLRLFLR